MNNTFIFKEFLNFCLFYSKYCSSLICVKFKMGGVRVWERSTKLKILRKSLFNLTCHSQLFSYETKIITSFWQRSSLVVNLKHFLVREEFFQEDTYFQRFQDSLSLSFSLYHLWKDKSWNIQKRYHGRSLMMHFSIASKNS